MGTGGMAEEPLLFTEMAGEGNAVTTRFRTSGARYWSPAGYTLWTAWGEDLPLAERTVTMNKPAGYGGAGYGLVLYQGRRFFQGREENSLLTVMINNNGQYALGKVVGGDYENIQWWTNSPLLREGPGAPNTITLRPSGEGFDLLINNVFVRTVADETEPRHVNGRNGYIVVIAPVDKYSEGGVDVYFTETK